MRSIAELARLDGRTALITGGGGHIGSTMADALAECGAQVAILDSAEKRADQIAKRIAERHGVPTTALRVDLRDEVAVRSVPGRVRADFDGLDVIVHCAALVGTSELEGWAVPLADQSLDTWRSAIEVNLTAPFLLDQICAPLLRSSGHGSIIHIGSIYGVCGPDMKLYGDDSTLGNPAAYAASKGGLVQLTRWMATTLAPDVRVNTISLGGVFRGHADDFRVRYEERTPLARMATEEDLKGAAVYLASDLSSYVTGHNLMIDGGWTAW